MQNKKPTGPDLFSLWKRKTTKFETFVRWNIVPFEHPYDKAKSIWNGITSKDRREIQDQMVNALSKFGGFETIGSFGAEAKKCIFNAYKYNFLTTRHLFISELVEQSKKDHSYGGTLESQAQLDHRNGGTLESQAQLDCRFGGSGMSQAQLDHSYGGSGMSQAQLDHRYGGINAPEPVKRGPDQSPRVRTKDSWRSVVVKRTKCCNIPIPVGSLIGRRFSRGKPYYYYTCNSCCRETGRRSLTSFMVSETEPVYLSK